MLKKPSAGGGILSSKGRCEPLLGSDYRYFGFRGRYRPLCIQRPSSAVMRGSVSEVSTILWC